MKLKNILFLSTIILSQLSTLATDAAELRIRSDQIKSACPHCPEVLQTSRETNDHSLQHYIRANIEVLPVKEVVEMAREDRSTSVLIIPEFSFEELIEQLNHSNTSWTLDKKALSLLESNSPTIGYLAKMAGYEFIAVICRADRCDDDARGIHRSNVFVQGEVISIYPICGPEVLSIPERKKLNQYLKDHGDKNLSELINSGITKINRKACSPK